MNSCKVVLCDQASPWKYRRVTQDDLLKILEESDTPSFNGVDVTPHIEFIKSYYLSKLAALPKKTHVKFYKYFVTFTTRSDVDLVRAEAYVRERAQLSWVEHMDFVAEYSDNQMYHFHCLFETNIPVQKAKQFGHYQKQFGFVDFKPVKPQTEQHILKYMGKDAKIEHLK